MKIVVAPQSLKGSLDAEDVGTAIANGIRAVFPDAELIVLPVADGGDGTVDALVSATQGQRISAAVHGPVGEQVNASFALLGTPSNAASEQYQRTAVIEMAAASGLTLVPAAQRDPRIATSYGTGELMLAVLDAGCQHMIIGIGGSATNDGGAGMAQALGARLVDDAGNDLPFGGAALARLAHIDVSGVDARLKHIRIEVACDVTNPLYGPEGASAIYGPQKGATPEMVSELDVALQHYAAILRRDLGADVADVPGAGAAGGLGAGLLAFAQAKLLPGARLILDALDFAAVVQGAALVVTAEGRLDSQTTYGKIISEVASSARQAGAKVIALAGAVTATEQELAALGIDVALPICDGPLTLEASMARAAELLSATAARAMRLIAIGQAL